MEIELVGVALAVHFGHNVLVVVVPVATSGREAKCEVNFPHSLHNLNHDLAKPAQRLSELLNFDRGNKMESGT